MTNHETDSNGAAHFLAECLRVNTLFATFDNWSKAWPRYVQNPPEDSPFKLLLFKLHLKNFTLWRHEDRIRRTDLPDAEIVRLKRAIDRENQARNDAIEAINLFLYKQVVRPDRPREKPIPVHTESPGAILDRLSILSLRIHHLEDGLKQPDAGVKQCRVLAEKLEHAQILKTNLSSSAQVFFDELTTGRRTFFIMPALKLYNDPNTNPELSRSSI